MENNGKEKDEKEGVREEGKESGKEQGAMQAGLKSGATRAAMGLELRKTQRFNYQRPSFTALSKITDISEEINIKQI